MARIRTIKPEFFTSEDIVALAPITRLLFIALWCEADKRGRMSWKPNTFKMRYLPGDNCDIESLCAELVSGGLVRLYGDGLAYIPSFEKHQHVNPRETESGLPEPDGWRDSGPRKVGKTLREAVLERDGFKCVRCGSEDSPQVDHILPQSAGGPHIIENLRTLCRACNAGRPVAGPALDEDLKRDGFTVESLRVKFGIDASILDLHAQGGREGKGREGNVDDASRHAPPPADPKGDSKTESPRATRLPAHWTLPADWRQWAKDERPDVDPGREADRFADYWRAKPGKDGTKLDWLATWRNWVRGVRSAPVATGDSSARKRRAL